MFWWGRDWGWAMSINKTLHSKHCCSKTLFKGRHGQKSSSNRLLSRSCRCVHAQENINCPTSPLLPLPFPLKNNGPSLIKGVCSIEVKERFGRTRIFRATENMPLALHIDILEPGDMLVVTL